MKTSKADFEAIKLTIGSYLEMINDPLFTEPLFDVNIYSSGHEYTLDASSDEVCISFAIKKKGDQP